MLSGWLHALPWARAGRGAVATHAATRHPTNMARRRLGAARAGNVAGSFPLQRSHPIGAGNLMTSPSVKLHGWPSGRAGTRSAPRAEARERSIAAARRLLIASVAHAHDYPGGGGQSPPSPVTDTGLPRGAPLQHRPAARRGGAGRRRGRRALVPAGPAGQLRLRAARGGLQHRRDRTGRSRAGGRWDRRARRRGERPEDAAPGHRAGRDERLLRADPGQLLANAVRGLAAVPACDPQRGPRHLTGAPR